MCSKRILLKIYGDNFEESSCFRIYEQAQLSHTANLRVARCVGAQPQCVQNIVWSRRFFFKTLKQIEDMPSDKTDKMNIRDTTAALAGPSGRSRDTLKTN